jgi:hypothetical protein
MVVVSFSVKLELQDIGGVKQSVIRVGPFVAY